MNFELKPLSLVEAASEKCDVLLVLLTDSYKPAKDGFSAFVARTIKDGDTLTKAGKLLPLYKHSMAQATRVVLVGVGDGSRDWVRRGGQWLFAWLEYRVSDGGGHGDADALPATLLGLLRDGAPDGPRRIAVRGR